VVHFEHVSIVKLKRHIERVGALLEANQRFGLRCQYFACGNQVAVKLIALLAMDRIGNRKIKRTEWRRKQQTTKPMNTTTTQKEVLQRERIAHHRALESLRAPSCSKSGIQIWRKLIEIERLAHIGATAWCNREDNVHLSWPLFGVRCYNFHSDENAWDSLKSVVTDCVRNIFGQVPDGFFVNGDARGYALKLDPDSVTIPQGMHTDWGRNGILAAMIDN